jgi:hypothetical protein
MTGTNTVFRIDIDETRHPVVAYGEKCLGGTIRIGDFTESFEVPVDLWSVADYKRQWQEGIGRFLAGTAPSCLVTGMRDPEQGVLITIWPLYVEHENNGAVVIQHKTLFFRDIRMRFTGRNFYDLVGPREFMTEDGDPISEWVIARSSLVDFLKELD